MNEKRRLIYYPEQNTTRRCERDEKLGDFHRPYPRDALHHSVQSRRGATRVDSLALARRVK